MSLLGVENILFLSLLSRSSDTFSVLKYAYTYVRMLLCARVHICVHGKASRQSWVSLFGYCPPCFIDTGSLAESGNQQVGWTAGQGVPGILQFSLSTAGIRRTGYCGFFSLFLGIKLSSSCLFAA